MSDEDFWDRVGPETEWLQRQLRRLGVPEADLDDLTQDVIVTVHSKWNVFDRSRSIRSWLFGFAFRIASDHRRRRERRGAGVDSGDVELVADSGRLADPERGASDKEAREILLRALEALDDERRAMIVLVDLEDMSVVDAAAVLEIPLNTGYSRLRVARQQLAEAVRKLASDERRRS